MFFIQNLDECVDDPFVFSIISSLKIDCLEDLGENVKYGLLDTKGDSCFYEPESYNINPYFKLSLLFSQIYITNNINWNSFIIDIKKYYWWRVKI